MDDTAISNVLLQALPHVDYQRGAATDQPTLYVTPADLVETCRTLRDHPDLRVGLLVDVTAVDWWPNEPRFEVVYHLASIDLRARLRLKVRLRGDDPRVPTITGIWPAAGWLEREVWDLFGVVFDGHGDLRRLLMPEDWEGHPLRKDYPVQVRMAVKIHEPLQVSEDEFRATMAADRERRRP